MLKPYCFQGLLEAGCDEAGRGCLAGPVCAASVILPQNFSNELLNDSKALTDKQRRELRPIIEQTALAWSVQFISVEEIDEINILNASIKGMNLAVMDLKIQPNYILIDGNRFKNQTNIPYKCIVHGDATYASIAAAYILAKTYRDDYMETLDKQFPQYGWKQNKGYPTAIHRNAIRQYGATIHHRKSFTLIPPQLKLPFDE